jgi:Rapid ALkalinization Factor (RALF)
MATPTKTTVCVLFLLAFVISVSAGDTNWVKTGRRLGDDAELEFGGSLRRVLATSDYISYGALQADSTPCSVRGASYYNCRPGASANPYDRGCSAITQCRS